MGNDVDWGQLGLWMLCRDAWQGNIDILIRGSELE